MKPQPEIKGLSLLSGRPSFAHTVPLLGCPAKRVAAFYILLCGLWPSCMFEP